MPSEHLMYVQFTCYVYGVVCRVAIMTTNSDHYWKLNYTINVPKSFFEKCRSSLLEVFCKNIFLRNFAKLTRKHLRQSLFFNKAAGLRRCFPVNFVKFPRTPFLQNTSRRLLLSVSCSHFIKTTCKNMKILLYKNTFCERFWVFKKQYSHKMKYCIKCNQK